MIELTTTRNSSPPRLLATQVLQSSGGLTTGYNVNNLNQYTSAGGASYGYDADGNMTSKQSGGAWSYAYDDENRLTAVSGPGKSWTYQYDALGNRVAQSNGGTTTQYLVDPLGLSSAVAEFDGSGKLVSHFTYGLDLTSLQSSSGTSFYQFDGSANTATVTGAGRAVLDAYSYLPFGEKLQSTVTVTNPFTFAGQVGIRDDGNGLYYMRARYYDPSIGRFISEDPLGVDSGDGTNFYIYVDNNPIAFIDPSGLVHCVGGADCNFTPPMQDAMQCFDRCTGRDTAITSGRRPPSSRHPNSSHSRGEACDAGRNANPGLTPAQASSCFQQCFPHGYGQEEHNQSSGTHYHFQLNTVPGGRPGFANGIQPYNP